MVSLAVFSAATCVYQWAAPLGAVLGLAVCLTEDEEIYQGKDEFEEKVMRALSRTKHSLTSDSMRAIVDELSKQEVVPDSVTDLMSYHQTAHTNCHQIA